jgi:hypothetical protein
MAGFIAIEQALAALIENASEADKEKLSEAIEGFAYDNEPAWMLVRRNPFANALVTEMIEASGAMPGLRKEMERNDAMDNGVQHGQDLNHFG